MIGRTLSHYKILSEISRGGMGIVYRALDLKLDREVALKVLPPDLVADSERKRRFVQEAKAAAKLEHPHIGVVYEIDETDGVTFIAMELIRGEQLRDTIAKGPVPLRRALEISTDIAEGLAKAHDEGIVHRDLKPANVMVTEDGHTKIIDFGLAKLIEPLAGEGSDIETLTRNGETDPGKVMGTVSYMSPEQARGQKVDHRSDIFSFGIVLHEMVNGRLPFEGKSGLDTLHAILNDAAPRLSDLGSNVPDDTRFELQHIVDKCLSKEPGERYQTIHDTVIDLRSARRHLESGSVSPVVYGPRRKFGLLAAVAGVIAVLIIGWLVSRPQTSPLEPVPSPGSKPSIAVLYFENASGDPKLDWLRTGLTDMLVTDLSQSPNLTVLSTDRLYQILSDMNRLDERITSLKVVQEVAREANTDTVILGSFMKAGDNVRINIRVQDVTSGEILTTEKAEGIGESSIFSMVDDLTRRIKTDFEIPEAAEADFDRYIQDVTTSSLEAYRYYVEGVKLDSRGQFREAIPLFEKALEVDPHFARARINLSSMYGNIGQYKLREEYRRQAVEDADRLPLRDRYYVEGSYYALKEETYERAFKTLEESLEIYPDDNVVRNNLALRYRHFERYDDAIDHYEEAIRRKFAFVGAYDNLAICYSCIGQFEKGYEILQGYLAQHPDGAAGYQRLGQHFIRWGKLDQALEAFQTSESILPDPQVQLGRWHVFVLREKWELAESAAKQAVDSNDPRLKWSGSRCLARLHLYHGRSHEALTQIDQAVNAYEDPQLTTAEARIMAADVLLEQGNEARALEQAREAQREGKGNFPEWEGLFLVSLAYAKLGQWEETEKTLQELRQRTASLPTEKEKRRYHRLLGELAMIRGDITKAVDELEIAQSMLHPRGFLRVHHDLRIPQHVPIWFSLAKAYLESRR